jgi:hypothetical protein
MLEEHFFISPNGITLTMVMSLFQDGQMDLAILYIIYYIQQIMLSLSLEFNHLSLILIKIWEELYALPIPITQYYHQLSQSIHLLLPYHRDGD